MQPQDKHPRPTAEYFRRALKLIWRTKCTCAAYGYHDETCCSVIALEALRKDPTFNQNKDMNA